MSIRLMENFRAVFYAPYYATYAHGFYGREGVEVELLTSDAPGDAVPKLMDGTIDLTWGGPMRVMKAHDQDKHSSLVSFCEVVSHDPFFLIGRRSAQPFRLSDLKQMKFASVSEVPTPWMCLQRDLREQSIDPDVLPRIADRAMRSGVQALGQEHDLAHPLAHRAVLDTVGTTGMSFVAHLPGGWYEVGAGTQGAFESVVRVYFSALTYDEIGVASAWRPFEHVTLDPRIQAGAPCVTGTRIPTATIARVLESEPAEEIAQEYGITIDEVEAADKFEQQLIDGHGLAA